MTTGPARPLARQIRRAPGRVRRRLRGAPQAEWSRTRPALVVRARRLVRLVRRRWRRSMRLRVIATTMLLGLGVVLVLGNFLLARIRDGLVEAREATVMVESERLTQQAQELLYAAGSTTGPQQDQMVNDTMGKLESSGGSESRGVVLLRAQSSTEPAPAGTRMSGRSSIGVSPAVIPPSLRDAVNERSRQQLQITTLPAAGDPQGRPAIAVGSMIEVRLAGSYELYFIYPLDREQEILDLVRRTFLVGGAALVVLVGAVAYTVTRQVVAPVRQAARTAEELASGRLDRRMRVRGEDDMARLGRAFNEMAGSLERQIHRLEELSRVQRRFVSDVSHELRTPLTTIRMASEVLHERRHEMDPAMARSAELLQAQLDRFEALLTDLLEISRFDAGAAVLEVEPADVREVVGRVVDVLAPLAERRNTQIRVEAPLEPCLAEIDAIRVERIVRNLLANAIEHGEGRPIDVRVAASSDAVAVGVLDHGSGIDPSELAMVFNRFWRADPARARSTGGTGLGLAIAQEDAHLHGGWLQAWGEPGIGANFRLTLPRRAGVVLVGSPLPLVPYGADTSVSLDLHPPIGQTAIPFPPPTPAGGIPGVPASAAPSPPTPAATGIPGVPPAPATTAGPASTGPASAAAAAGASGPAATGSAVSAAGLASAGLASASGPVSASDPAAAASTAAASASDAADRPPAARASGAGSAAAGSPASASAAAGRSPEAGAASLPATGAWSALGGPSPVSSVGAASTPTSRDEDRSPSPTDDGDASAAEAAADLRTPVANGAPASHAAADTAETVPDAEAAADAADDRADDERVPLGGPA